MRNSLKYLVELASTVLVTKSLGAVDRTQGPGESQRDLPIYQYGRPIILTYPRGLLFFLEVLQILGVLFVLWRLLIFGQLAPVLLFGLPCPALVLFPLFFREALPVLADNLGFLGKRKGLALELLASLWNARSESRKHRASSSQNRGSRGSMAFDNSASGELMLTI